MKYKNTFSACLSTLLLISSVWPNISAAQTSSDGNWVIKNKMPIARAAMAVASSGSQIFLIGGSAKSDGTYGVNSDVDTSGDDLLTYDASTDSWTSRQTGLSPARSLGKAEIINNTIYLAGGYYKGFYPAFVEGYSLTDNKWTTGGKMYTGRAGPASGVVGGQFMIIGGEAAGDSVPQVESYDTAKGEWSIKKPSNIGRGYAGSVMLHDKIYLVGGLNGAGVLSANETLDLVSNLWETHRPMPLARTAISNSVTALKGKLFVIGGWSTTGATPNVEIYDPVTDTWAESTPLPMPLYHAAAATVGDTIYVFGGFTADGKASDVVLSYNMPPPPPPPPAPKKLTPAEIKKAAQLEKLAKQKATELMVATKKQQIIFNQQAAELKKTLSLLQKLGIEVPSSLTEAIQQIKDRLNRITAQAIK